MTLALDALWHATAGDGTGHIAVDLIHDGKSVTLWAPAANRKRFLRLASPCEAWTDVHLSACPYFESESRRIHADSSCVWARVETTESAARLSRFQPSPTLTLREGASCRRVALWALRTPLSPIDCAKVNRHIAHALHAPKKYAEPGFAYPAPGTPLTVGRKRPVVVELEELVEEVYAIGEVCRWLPRVLPDPSAWKSRKAA